MALLKLYIAILLIAKASYMMNLLYFISCFSIKPAPGLIVRVRINMDPRPACI